MTSETRQATAATSAISSAASLRTFDGPFVAWVAIGRGLRYVGSEFGLGSSHAPRVINPIDANVAQTAGRHLGEGGWPSGNSRSISVMISTHPGIQTAVPNQSAHCPANGAW